MRDQHNEPLNDGLAREIEQALAVQPSPEFQACVRQRVAQESPVVEGAFGGWRPALWPATAIIATTAIALAGWQLGSFSSMNVERASLEETRIQDQPGPKQQPAQSIASTATPQPATPGTTQGTTARPGVRNVQPSSTMATLDWLAPVIVAEDEIAGMRALIADAQAGRFESVVVTEEPVLAVVTTARATADVPAEPASEATLASAPDATDQERAPAGAGQNVPQAPRTQIASAVVVRPIVIEPLTIKPVVQSLPDEKPEGAAE